MTTRHIPCTQVSVLPSTLLQRAHSPDHQKGHHPDAAGAGNATGGSTDGGCTIPKTMHLCFPPLSSVFHCHRLRDHVSRPRLRVPALDALGSAAVRVPISRKGAAFAASAPSHHPAFLNCLFSRYVCSMVVLFGNFYLYAYVFQVCLVADSRLRASPAPPDFCLSHCIRVRVCTQKPKDAKKTQ